MFKSRTLFVVGAGASCEADLPSGEQLKGKISSLLDIRFDYDAQQTGDHQITHALREAVQTPNGQRGDINPYLHKAWRIRDVVPAAAISIDNFLDAHQGDAKMELCGKLGIVKSILLAEAASKLRSVERGSSRFNLRGMGGTWYVGFFQMLTENVSKNQLGELFDNVAIITFNYDRCIERFLVQALADYYELTDEESQVLVSHLPIYHPYGQVGKLPWQQRRNGVPFGSSETPLLELSREIKTFTEGLDDEELIEGIHRQVADAETIVFLGFAFHPSNMELLTPRMQCSAKRIFATTYSLSDADEAVIVDDIWKMLGLQNMPFHERHAMEPEMAKLKCGDFFQHYFRSMSAPLADD